MTQLQARAIKNMVENGGNIGRAMINAGYSKATAKTPQKLTKSKSWKQVMQKYLPDYKLFRKHEEALDATKLHGTNSDFVEIPDHAIRLKAVEIAYKLKGKYTENLGNNYQQINITFDGSGYIPPDNVLGSKPTILSKNK